MLKSLEDYMNERQHHLNENSSARLGRSWRFCRAQIVSRRRVWAPIFWWTHSFGAYILIGAEISTSALFLSYIMRRINFIIPHSFAANICRLYFVAYVLLPTFATYICRLYFVAYVLPPTFVAYICRLHLPPTFAAYILLPMFAANICRIHLPPTFAPYILEIRLHFEQPPIIHTCANILGKCQYFDDFLQWVFAWFFCCKYLCIFSVFIYAFLCAPIFLAQLFWSLGLRLM